MVKSIGGYFVLSSLCLCSSWIATLSVFGSESPDERPDETSAQIVWSHLSDQDRATIGRSTHSVWYDAKVGSIHPIRSSKSVDVEDRHDSIAGNFTRTAPSWWTSLKKLITDFFTLLFQGWQILLLVCLVGLLLIAATFIFRFRHNFQALAGKMSDGAASEREKAKLLDLPFEVEQTMFGLLAQAEKYRAAGDYSKAIIYLFSHALVEMDSARCIRLARGKTNRAYLRELHGRENLSGFTDQLVLAFEYTFFGKHVLSQEAFERIWQQVPAFDAHIKNIGLKLSLDHRSISMGNP